jgi:hypothetical protein
MAPLGPAFENTISSEAISFAVRKRVLNAVPCLKLKLKDLLNIAWKQRRITIKAPRSFEQCLGGGGGELTTKYYKYLP